MKKTLVCSLIIFFFYGCKNDEIDRVEFYAIENSINLNEKSSDFFNEYLLDCPCSDYLVGMKSFFLLSENKKIEAESLISSFETNCGNHKLGTFVKMGKALLVKEHDTEEYLKKLKESYDMDSDFKNKHVRQLIYEYYYYDKNDISSSLPYMVESLIIDKSYVHGLMNFALYLLHNGQKELANFFLDRIIKIRNYSYASYWRSFDYLEKRDYILAKKILLKGLLDNKIPEIYIQLARVSSLEKNTKMLDYYIDMAYSLSNNNMEVLQEIGWFYVENENFEKAITMFEESIADCVGCLNDKYYGLVYSNICAKKFGVAQDIIDSLRIEKIYEDEVLVFYQVLNFHFTNNENELINLLSDYKKNSTKEDFQELEEILRDWGVKIEFRIKN